MTTAMILTALYLAVAAYAYRFMLGIPAKSGHPVTREDMIRTTKREGLALAVFAVLWLPILCYLFGAGIVHAVVDRRAGR